MDGENTPVSRLTGQLEDLRNTLRTIDQAKDQLRPELKHVTGELNLLLSHRSGDIDPLFQLPRVLGSILKNPKIGALVFSEDGQRILHNSRAEFLLGKLTQHQSTGGGESDAGGCRIEYPNGEALQREKLPWFAALENSGGSESELVVVDDNGQKRHLRVTVNPLVSAFQSPSKIGGVIAFIADITEHVLVVSELTAICDDTQAKLDKFNTGLTELSALVKKLSSVKHHDLPEPRAKKKQSENVEVEKPQENGPAPLGAGLRVLIADDVAVNQKLLKLQLEKLGFKTSTANDGKDAYDLAAREDFDLILMDCDMPRVDGYEAAGMVRSLDGSRGNVPIIAVTAYDRDGDRQKCLDSGMNDYITKGSPERDLKELLVKWLPSLKNYQLPEEDDSLDENTRARQVLFESEAVPHGSERRNNSVDYERLKREYGDREAQEIIKLFVGVTGTFVECLDLALSSKDEDAVNHFAYSIKGPLSSLRLFQQAELAGRLPQLASKHKWKEARRVYSDLIKAYQPVKTHLEQLSGK